MVWFRAIIAGLAITLTGTQALAGSSYSIPDEFTPVSKWVNGFTAEEADKFRKEYSAADYIIGNDVTAFAFLNISEILTTMIIPRGKAIADLEIKPMPKIGEVIATTKLGTMPLSNAIADSRSRFQAIAVLHKGKIVFESYPGMQQNQMHVWNSASKTITGLIIHQLVNEGLVDLNERVSTYLPYTKDSPVGDTKIEDLLHQRTGLDYEENQKNFQNPNHPLGIVLKAAMSPRGERAGPSVSEVLVTVKKTKQPNRAFEYSSLNTQILGFIIEKVTGKPWNRVVSDRIWSRTGMEGDALLGLSSNGEGLHGGIFASRLRDLARFALLFTPSRDVIAKEVIVPKNYLKNVYAAINPQIYRKGFQGKRMVAAFGEDDAPVGTSYQWDAIFKDGDLYKAGLGGQAIYVSPETDTVIVYFSTTYDNSLSLISYAREIVKKIFR